MSASRPKQNYVCDNLMSACLLSEHLAVRPIFFAAAATESKRKTNVDYMF